MDRAFDALVKRLEDQPPGEFVVLGVAPGGHELRAARRVRSGVLLGPGDAVPPHVTVCVEVPEAPRGRVEFVLVRWNDDERAMSYHSLSDDAVRPEWTHLKCTRHGVRLTVRWARRGTRRYDFHWTDLPDDGSRTPSTK